MKISIYTTKSKGIDWQSMEALNIFTTAPDDLLAWPIVTEEDEQAVLKVLRQGKMSGTDITKKFEQEFAAWIGMKYALGYCNGTASLPRNSFFFCTAKGRQREKSLYPVTSCFTHAKVRKLSHYHCSINSTIFS
jgi:hypothetical protein